MHDFSTLNIINHFSPDNSATLATCSPDNIQFLLDGKTLDNITCCSSSLTLGNDTPPVIFAFISANKLKIHSPFLAD